MENQLKQVEGQTKQAALQAELQAKTQEGQQRLAIDQATAQADIKLKGAQTMKTAEEARAQDIENDAVESGISDLVEGGGIEEMQARVEQAEQLQSDSEQKCIELEAQPHGPKVITVTRTEEGLVGVIVDAEGNERKAVVNSTEDGMIGTVEAE